MGLFKSKQEKNLEQKLAIKKTLNNLNKQIEELEKKKKTAIEKARVARESGLNAEYNLALSLYRASVSQQKRAREMLLNFEITTQMKDMATLTKEFLKGLSILSREMVSLTNNKDFLKVQQQFEKAITGVETQSKQLDSMMDTGEQKFTEVTNSEDAISDEDFANLVDEMSSQENEGIDDLSNIDKELENLRKKIDEIQD